MEEEDQNKDEYKDEDQDTDGAMKIFKKKIQTTIPTQSSRRWTKNKTVVVYGRYEGYVKKIFRKDATEYVSAVN